MTDVENEYEEDYGDGLDANCQTCGGDGFEECNEPWCCFERDCDGDIHTCPNCRGSGCAKDQWYW